MQIIVNLLSQIRASRFNIALALIVSAIILSAIIFLHLWKGIPVGKLTRDPAAIFRAPYYSGLLSQLGIFFWSASAAVCMFCLTVIPRNPDSLRARRFLLISGMLTLLLAFDDAFLLHESLFPRFGVPEKVVFLSYAIFVLLYLVKYYTLILKTEYALLMMALAFFGTSVILDLADLRGKYRYLIEDGAKIIGIVSWMVYFFRVGAEIISWQATNKVSATQSSVE